MDALQGPSERLRPPSRAPGSNRPLKGRLRAVQPLSRGHGRHPPLYGLRNPGFLSLSATRAVGPAPTGRTPASTWAISWSGPSMPKENAGEDPRAREPRTDLPDQPVDVVVPQSPLPCTRPRKLRPVEVLGTGADCCQRPRAKAPPLNAGETPRSESRGSLDKARRRVPPNIGSECRGLSIHPPH